MNSENLCDAVVRSSCIASQCVAKLTDGVARPQQLFLQTIPTSDIFLVSNILAWRALAYFRGCFKW